MYFRDRNNCTRAEEYIDYSHYYQSKGKKKMNGMSKCKFSELFRYVTGYGMTSYVQ